MENQLDMKAISKWRTKSVQIEMPVTIQAFIDKVEQSKKKFQMTNSENQ